MTNFFPGLARGPIDHQSSSVINAVSNDSITMGSAVIIIDPPVSELLPRVVQLLVAMQDPTLITNYYGIVVGGDLDGIYGTGAIATSDINRAGVAGDGVVVVTQGRCLARVNVATVAIKVGDALSAATTSGGGVLEKAVAAASANAPKVIARALQDVDQTGAPNEIAIIAVDVQREGELTT